MKVFVLVLVMAILLHDTIEDRLAALEAAVDLQSALIKQLRNPTIQRVENECTNSVDCSVVCPDKTRLVSGDCSSPGHVPLVESLNVLYNHQLWYCRYNGATTVRARARCEVIP
eukprot:TRINITY_DN8026_c0_g1_i1.p1 TRINITY_DN8026_c0_g1~~TRINITY_DN8026_c0_g1_i1.p1  ORF type:complete len:114 (-),score=5.89 TRINITY_DN8026_c0_g1_i1:173-514(-)